MSEKHSGCVCLRRWRDYSLTFEWGPGGASLKSFGIQKNKAGKEPSQKRLQGARSNESGRIMDKVIDYLEGKSVELPVSALDMSALTEFQRRVSETLIKHAPRGSALTYAELSALSGCPGGARAAGNVMANNPFPLFIPCHRVIKSGGAIGNYGPGPDLKRWLLEKEGFLAQNMA